MGASPIVPPIKGVEQQNVFTLRTIEDGLKIKSLLKNSKIRKAAIIGGGYIGLEMAENLKNWGLEVSVFEMLPHILPLFDKEYADKVEDVLIKNGVSVYKNCKINEIIGQNGTVTGHIDDAGNFYANDLILLSAGVRPNSALAREAGIKTGLAGGIQVDEFMQTSHSRVWACGDCVQMYDLISKKPVYMPLGPTANKQGRIAGENALGAKTAFLGVLGTQATKIFDTFVASTGLSEQKAQEFGFDTVAIKITKNDKASYYPGTLPSQFKLVLEKESGRVLGASILGSENAVLRINVLVAAITAGFSVHQLNNLDLVYAPPVAPVYDPILIAASEGLKSVGQTRK
jgi:NADPH-dependent 2,4-dienoyl-CoA reductase/sulfur reductase-like enzyme